MATIRAIAPLLIVLASTSAFAADADPFMTAGSLATGTGTLQGEAPTVGTEGISAGINVSVAKNLAVFQYTNGGEDPILDDVLSTEIYGGWTFGKSLRLDVFLPVYLYAEAPFTERQGPGMGDIRVQGLIPLVGETGDSFSVALLPQVGLPTGSDQLLLRRGFSGGLTGAVGGETGKFGWLGNLGLTLAKSDELAGVTLGSTFDVVGGIYYSLQPGFRVGADAKLTAGLASGLTGQGNSLATGDIFAQTHNPSGVGMTIGAGTGLIGGVGAPDWRVFAALTYGSTVRDSDDDGFMDPDDGCPLDAEDFDEFEDQDGCPEADNDKDGILDVADACRNEPEDPDGFSDDDGCPDPDNDDDGVLDNDDECPLSPGLAEFAGCPDTDKDGLTDAVDQCPEDAGPKELNGCPDRDQDQVPDFRDACPDEPKPVEEDPTTSDGCPKRVYITATQVKITEKVFFETGKFTIKPESFGLLDDVAAALVKAPWVTKVEVGGHTDDKGSDAANLKLSDGRAAAVAQYLTGKGVAKERLVSKGYGEAAPIDTNRTTVGQANNRRVEFKILEQTPPKIEAKPGPSGKLVPAQPQPTDGTLVPTGTTTPAPAGTTAPSGTAAPTPATPAQTTPVKPAVAAPAGAPGMLTVALTGVGWADVYVDDQKLGRTAPFRDVSVASGRHTIVVVNPRSGLNWEQIVDVKPGESTTITAVRGGTPPAAEPAPASPWTTTP